ncbi:hypothetical protein Hdeb2414_s0546g00914871 [Helianthus debilis subsp. tardiflorus]
MVYCFFPSFFLLPTIVCVWLCWYTSLKTEEQRPKDKPKANENKPVMNE